MPVVSPLWSEALIRLQMIRSTFDFRFDVECEIDVSIDDQGLGQIVVRPEVYGK